MRSAVSRAAERLSPSPQSCAAAVLEIMPTVMDAMRGAMRAQAGEHMSVPQFRCLYFISLNPGCSVSAVAGFLGVSLPTASAMVDRLARGGAVAPITAAADRRRWELHLTEAGRAQVLHIRSGALNSFAHTLVHCTAEDLSTLQAGLAVLQQAFQAA